MKKNPTPEKIQNTKIVKPFKVVEKKQNKEKTKFIKNLRPIQNMVSKEKIKFMRGLKMVKTRVNRRPLKIKVIEEKKEEEKKEEEVRITNLKDLIFEDIKSEILKIEIIWNLTARKAWKTNYYAIGGFWKKDPFLDIETIVFSLTKIQTLFHKIFEVNGNVLILNQMAGVKNLYQKLFCKQPLFSSNSWIPGQLSNFNQIQRPLLKNNQALPTKIDLIFNLDVGLTNSAMNEIQNKNIVLISLVKTNCRSQNISYKIPANSNNGRASVFFALFFRKLWYKKITLKTKLDKKKYVWTKLISRYAIFKRKKWKNILNFLKKHKSFFNIDQTFPIALSCVVSSNRLKFLRPKGAKWLKNKNLKKWRYRFPWHFLKKIR